MIKNFLNNHKDLGILVLRLGIGIPFILVYGLFKVESGPDMWTQIGSAMGNLGITFFPTFWGVMAAMSEFIGGILLVLGLFVRPAALFMSITMSVAAIQHFSIQDQWYNVVTPLEMLSVFIAIIFLSAGKYSLDHLFFGKRGKRNRR
ncbi:MAG: DoxX family protein [Ignavibacteria bacterium]